MPEDVGVFRFGLLRFDRLRLARWHGFNLVDGVIANGVRLCGRKALAFGGHHMQELRAVQLPDVLQGFNQQWQIVAINGADVVEAQFLEQRARGNHALEVFFGFLRQRHQVWGAFQHFLAAVPNLVVGSAGQQLGKIVGQPAHVAGDRHVIIVQDNQHIGVQVAGVVQGLKGHTGGHGAVANHRNALAPGILHAGCNGHAQCGADGGAGVANTEGVVFTFRPFREPGQAILAADAAHLFPAPGQDLVGVGLVAYIPDQPIFGGIEDIVQGDGQFQNAQAGTKVAAGLADRPEQESPEFSGQLWKIFLGQGAQLGGHVNPVKNGRVGPLRRDFPENVCVLHQLGSLSEYGFYDWHYKGTGRCVSHFPGQMLQNGVVRPADSCLSARFSGFWPPHNRPWP